jgi:hypothetical protein
VVDYLVGEEAKAASAEQVEEGAPELGTSG